MDCARHCIGGDTVATVATIELVNFQIQQDIAERDLQILTAKLPSVLNTRLTKLL